MLDHTYVLEIYKERSFSKAAKNLYISQPSLSATIRKIESRLGVKIFDRSSNDLALTPAGEAYVEAALKITEIENDLTARLEGLSTLQTGNISLAGTAFFSSSIIPAAAALFGKRYPGVKLEFFEADSLELYEKSGSGHIDLIVDAGSYDRQNFKAETLYEESILLAVPANDPAGKRFKDLALTSHDIEEQLHLKQDVPGISLDLFKDRPFILLKKEHDLYKRAMLLAQERDFTPVSSVHLNQLMTAFHLARQGIGISLVSDSLIRFCRTAENILYFKLNAKDPSLTHRPVFIAHKKNAPVTRAMEVFMETAKEIFLTFPNQLRIL